MATQRAATQRELVGVLPAAGTATRLGKLPCSKEILPLGIAAGDTPGRSVRVALDCALDALVAAGVNRVLVVLAPNKTDVRDYLGDGADRGLAVDYLTLADSPGAAWSIDAARPKIGEADTLLAFPDIQFRPTSTLRALAEARATAAADLWLGLVPSDRGEKVDLVHTDTEGRVTDIAIKPGSGQHGWTWVGALWGRRFGEFLGAAVMRTPVGAPERHVGDFINEALAAGFVVRTVPFADGWARDVGTPEDLAREWREARR